MLEFEWDPRKAKLNVAKHRVSFEEAETCFGDPLAETIEDEVHSLNEERLITIGLSAKGRLLVVCHTYRDEVIRIISARQATKSERELHETI